MTEETVKERFIPQREKPIAPAADATRQAVGETARVQSVAGAVNPESLLRGNELIILMVRPSLWYIVAASFRFCAIVLLLAVLLIHTQLVSNLLEPKTAWLVAFGLAGIRMIYALLEWASHLYLLTTCRIVTIKGARHPTIFEAGLAHVSETRLMEPAIQHILGLGTIGFATSTTIDPGSLWEWVPHARRVHQQIQAAISKRRGM